MFNKCKKECDLKLHSDIKKCRPLITKNKKDYKICLNNIEYIYQKCFQNCFLYKQYDIRCKNKKK